MVFCLCFCLQSINLEFFFNVCSQHGDIRYPSPPPPPPPPRTKNHCSNYDISGGLWVKQNNKNKTKTKNNNNKTRIQQQQQQQHKNSKTKTTTNTLQYLLVCLPLHLCIYSLLRPKSSPYGRLELSCCCWLLYSAILRSRTDSLHCCRILRF